MELNVPQEYLITDPRKTNEFKGKTISNFKKRDVINGLQDAMVNQNIEDACRWFIELNCSNYNFDIWIEIVTSYCKHVNINNFRLLELIFKKYNYYIQIVSNIDKKNEIHLRNNQEIRHLYTNLICQVALSIKNDLFNKRKIPKVKEVDFQREGLLKNMKCTNLDLIIDLVNENDIKEFKIAVNEISYHIRVSQNFTMAVFWYQWICKLSSLKKKAGIQLTINTFNIGGIQDKYKSDWIWLLWKILLNETMRKTNKRLTYVIKMLYKLYKINYKTSDINKRHFMIYQVIYCIIKQVNFAKCSKIKDHLCLQAQMNINKMYQAIDYNISKTYHNSTNFIEKENYVQKIQQDLHNEELKKKNQADKKVEKKDKQQTKEEYETTNKLSYLNDLMFIKKSFDKTSEKSCNKHPDNKKIPDYFNDKKDDNKIIYKNIIY
tara:strand:- start:122 stop:1423 length:1302 start_codon:yes stop_codon:yes gene_type:complete